MKNIGIIGCGWLGTKLAARLQGHYRVDVTVRTEERAAQLSSLVKSSTLVDFSGSIQTPWSLLPSLDALVIMIPFSLRNRTADDHQVKLTHLRQFVGAYHGPIYYTSSTGVYPRPPRTYVEDDVPQEATPVEHFLRTHYPQVTILRLAGLMGANRLLKDYAPKDLDNPVNHVHYDDACSAIIHLLERDVQEQVYNVVAPMHPSKRDVIVAQTGGTLGTMSPAEGRIISGAQLEALGFTFQYPDPRQFH